MVKIVSHVLDGAVGGVKQPQTKTERPFGSLSPPKGAKASRTVERATP